MIIIAQLARKLLGHFSKNCSDSFWLLLGHFFGYCSGGRPLLLGHFFDYCSDAILIIARVKVEIARVQRTPMNDLHVNREIDTFND